MCVPQSENVFRLLSETKSKQITGLQTLARDKPKEIYIQIFSV